MIMWARILTHAVKHLLFFMHRNRCGILFSQEPHGVVSLLPPEERHRNVFCRRNPVIQQASSTAAVNRAAYLGRSFRTPLIFRMYRCVLDR